MLHKTISYIPFINSYFNPTPEITQYQELEPGEEIPTLLQEIITFSVHHFKYYISSQYRIKQATITLQNRSRENVKLQTIQRKRWINLQTTEIRERKILYQNFIQEIKKILKLDEEAVLFLEQKLKKTTMNQIQNKKSPKLQNLGLTIKISENCENN